MTHSQQTVVLAAGVVMTSDRAETRGASPRRFGPHTLQRRLAGRRAGTAVGTASGTARASWTGLSPSLTCCHIEEKASQGQVRPHGEDDQPCVL